MHPILYADAREAPDQEHGHRDGRDDPGAPISIRQSLTALAVEGPLPAYAATIGEVGEVKREKDTFFSAVAAAVREQAEAAGVDLEVEVRPGHAAKLITRYARDINADLVVVGHKGHLLNDYLLGYTADRVAHHAPARC